MPIVEISKLRNSGAVRFSRIVDYPVHLDNILEMCGLKQLSEKLVALTAEQAEATLTSWLHLHPAYRTEFMSHTKAQSLAKAFVREFSDSTSKFYSNARWYEANIQSWTSLSDFIFDGGILIASGEGNYTQHVCLWFLDED